MSIEEKLNTIDDNLRELKSDFEAHTDVLKVLLKMVILKQKIPKYSTKTVDYYLNQYSEEFTDWCREQGLLT